MENIFIMNWWALLAGIAWSLILGMIWYSPKAFFPVWQKAVGLSDEDVKSGNPGRAMTFGLIANAVTVYFLGVIINVAGSDTLLAGVGFGALVSVGLITAAEINNGSFRQTKFVVYLIDGGYRLLMMAVAGALFAIW